MLGHRLGIHTLAAGPYAIAVDQVHEGFTASKWQLNPIDMWVFQQQCVEGIN